MEETAYLVDLLHRNEKPIVFSGAQRNAAVADTDGPRNLRDAVRLAADPHARGIGAVICMDGRVDGARNATKMDTAAVRAFGSPGHGPLASITDERVAVYGLPHRPCNIENVHALPHRVDVIRLYAGIDGTFFRAARHAGAKGLVLEAFGLGNANHEVVAEVAKAVDDGVIVLVCSRCRQGYVWPLYGNGGGFDLARAGALFAGDLQAAKARLLLMAAMAVAGTAREDVFALVEPHLYA
jgi:L-asparaginase